ncbi:Rqc2 family fibronectin-binding protein [Fictibacillus gelatini]|uniref:Rqc2 family fibronectin-binding protein n=1 Tax=Fictibacillus gelatini TaxID=225985 RepID=UPI002ADDC6FD|nr:NFACT RNA binding domain-containing protein [Fictibacillus gelatini]
MMSFDGIVTRAAANELSERLLSGRITKIYQPDKTDLLFTVRAGRKNYKLLISANSSFARIHLTEKSYDNPQVPPMFCMLLRKHLEGAIIEEIDQIEMERIIEIRLKNRDEIGDETYKKLIIEIMGRHSNIILIDEKTGMILDSIKHIPPSLNRHRTILPGQAYVAPPSQHKVSPLEETESGLVAKIDWNAGQIDRQLVQLYSGISPLIAAEITSRAGLPTKERIASAFFNVLDKICRHEYEPQMVATNEKEYFSVIHLTHLQGEVRSFETVSGLLDRFFYGKAERDRVKQQAADLERFIQNEIDKLKKKIKKLKATLQSTEKADQYRIFGELITAHMHLIKKGDKKVEVMNYYEEGQPVVTIDLDPLKTPSANAQSYFKKYNKLKSSISVVKEQIQIALEELEYFESLGQQMESASVKDIAEIREELEEQGYLKQRLTRQKRKAGSKPELESYLSSEGILIYVGKNNKQNDYLTHKASRQNETWLHTKDIPGSHVVIKAEKFGEKTLLEAANLAAYFSKARQSSAVPVDYTLIRHVKKPSGAKPGFVIYDNQQTIYVTPSEDLMLKLRQK